MISNYFYFFRVYDQNSVVFVSEADERHVDVSVSGGVQ